MRALLLILAASAGTGGTSAGAVLFGHVGDNVPEAEGWTEVSGGSLPEVPVDDGGTPSWSIHDNVATPASGYLVYRQIPTAQNVSDAAQLGWTLRANLRVIDGGGHVHGSVLVEYADGPRRYSMVFGSASATSDDLEVRLWNGDVDIDGSALGASCTLPGEAGASGAHHLYELTFDPVSGSSDLFVDGVERLGDYTGHHFLTPQTQVVWGAASDLDTGEGRYNLVEWRVPLVTGAKDPRALTGTGVAALGSAKPNPFRSLTAIPFELAGEARVSLAIFDVRGRRVRSLIDTEVRAPGRHFAAWDGREDSGRPVASGVYLYRIQSGRMSETRGMVLLR